MPNVIDVSSDLSGLRRLLIVLAAGSLVWMTRDPFTFLMWLGLAYFAKESHENYLIAKKYRRLGMQMRTAIK